MKIGDISWINGEYYEDEDFVVWKVKNGRLYSPKHKKYMVQLFKLEDISMKNFMGIPKEEAMDIITNSRKISKEAIRNFEEVYQSLAPYMPHTRKEFMGVCYRVKRHYGDKDIGTSIKKYFFDYDGYLDSPYENINALKRDGFF